MARFKKDRTMNYVFYFDCWTELGRPELRYHNLRYQMGPLIKGLVDKGDDVTVVIGEGLNFKAEKDNFDFSGANKVVILEEELQRVFSGYYEASRNLYEKKINRKQKKYIQLLEDKLPEKIDVFISFLSPADFLRDSYPDTKFLYTEFGIFSRAPYPRTFYFDPSGMFNNSIISKFSQEILEHEPLDSDKAKLKDIKSELLSEYLYEETNTESIEWLCELKLKYSKVILLPLQFSDYFGFDSHCKYKSQYDFLVDILNRVSPDIAVIATEHTGWGEVVNEHNISFLQNKYPNFITDKSNNAVNISTQELVPLVDGVISVSSSVGLQALFWDTPVFCEWDTHLKNYSSVTSIDHINKFFESNTTVDNSVLSIWLLKNYYKIDKSILDPTNFEAWVNDLEPFLSSGDFNDWPKSYHSLDEYTSEFRPKNNRIHKHHGKNSIALRKIARSSVVSFDVFDTLLERPFSKPHYLFLAMQNKVRKILGDDTVEFHKLRRLAEHRCRQDSEFDEVTIEEIYETLNEIISIDIDEQKLKEIIELEISTEKSVCKLKESNYYLYEYAKSLGKRVIFVTDIYHDESFIEELLSNAGIGKHTIFCSANLRKTKQEGSIFEHVIDTLSVKPGSILHIGDNRASDIVNAEKYGIVPLFVDKSISFLQKNKIYSDTFNPYINRRVFPNSNIELSYSVALGLLANKGFQKPHSDMFNGNSYELGYMGLGTLMFSFVKYLVDLIQDQGIKKVYFLSRDGKFIYDCVSSYLGDNKPDDLEFIYLKSSRKAYMLGSLNTRSKFINSLETPFEPTTVQNLLLKRYNIEDVSFIDSEMLESCGLESLEQVVHPTHQLIYLKNLFHEIYSYVEDGFVESNKSLINYFDEQGLYDDCAKCVVDIGYSGSLQRQLIENGIENLSGIYFSSHSKAKTVCSELNTEIFSYFPDFLDNYLSNHWVCRYIPMLETFFSSTNESSLVSIDKDSKTGESKFKYSQSSISPQRKLLIESIQLGSREFINELSSIEHKIETSIDLDLEFSSLILQKFLGSPCASDAKLFLGIPFDDDFSAKSSNYIIPPYSHVSNMTDKRQIHEKFIKLSKWKTGGRELVLQYNKRSHTAKNKPKSKLNNKIVEPKKPAKPKKLFTGKKYNKFKRNPYLFFSDSNKAISWMKFFYKK